MYIFFFLWPYLQHMEVPRLGVEPELQLLLTPQPGQHEIRAASVTYTAACGNAGSLTPWVRPGIKPASSQRQHWVLNLLSHNRNSQFFIFIYLYWSIIDLQCFRYTAKWFRFIYTHTYLYILFQIIFHYTLLWDIKHKFLVLDSRSVLFIYFIYSSCC